MYTSEQIIEKTNQYGAHNYAPKPVVIVPTTSVTGTPRSWPPPRPSSTSAP